MTYKLPRIPKDHIPYILRTAADKVERDEPLDTGYSNRGSRHIEGEIVTTVLRAVADGKSPVKALVGNGVLPELHLDTIQRVEDATTKYGSRKVAYEKIASGAFKWRKPVKAPRTAGAVEKQYKRALKTERERWRRAYLSGRWPKFPAAAWRMSDSEIEAQIMNDKMTNASSARTYWHTRRDNELNSIRKATGWKVLPPWGGDKEPP